MAPSPLLRCLVLLVAPRDICPRERSIPVAGSRRISPCCDWSFCVEAHCFCVVARKPTTTTRTLTARNHLAWLQVCGIAMALAIVPPGPDLLQTLKPHNPQTLSIHKQPSKTLTPPNPQRTPQTPILGHSAIPSPPPFCPKVEI